MCEFVQYTLVNLIYTVGPPICSQEADQKFHELGLAESRVSQSASSSSIQIEFPWDGRDWSGF
jgi:hypothetical protein